MFLISTASPDESLEVEVTTGHYSSERVALLFKPGTYAAGSEKGDCFGGLLAVVFFFLFKSIQRVGFLCFFHDCFQKYFFGLKTRKKQLVLCEIEWWEVGSWLAWNYQKWEAGSPQRFLLEKKHVKFDGSWLVLACNPKDVEVEVGYYVQVLGLGRHPKEVAFTSRLRQLSCAVGQLPVFIWSFRDWCCFDVLLVTASKLLKKTSPLE